MLRANCGRGLHLGISLIEVMVVTAVVAVVAGLAAPSFSTMMANYGVRSGAEGILMGLKLARSEAIRLNTNVDFTLASGAGWTVATVSPAQTLQTRPGSESGNSLQITSLNDQFGVIFLPTGRVSGYNTATTLTRLTVTSPASGAGTLRIDVFAGGEARMCDPGVTTADDPRKC